MNETEDSTQTNIQDVCDFESLKVSPEILRAVHELGYKEATSIQKRSIPIILSDRDVVGHSQTGTGKTAAFGIPAIDKIEKNSNGLPQVLVLCPTRELAVQIVQELRRFAKYKQVRVLPIYGGQSIDLQINSLKGGVDIVVGTPGRIMDHMNRRTLKLHNLKMVILDEADEMLNMGFRDDIETILKDVPQDRQTLLFSATMSKEIMSITSQYLTDPVLVKVVQKSMTLPNIKQYMYDIPKGAKFEVLTRLLDFHNPKRSMIFCNTKKMVDVLAEELRARGHYVEALHGDMKQFARNQVMETFKKGRVSILIATDVAARGLDIDNVEYVINFDLPQDLEYYVHRIGRTGRIGRDGTSLTLISGTKEFLDIKAIENHTKTKIELKTIPSLKEVQESKNQRVISNISTTIERGLLQNHKGIIEELLKQELDPVEIGAGLLKMLFSTDKDYKENYIDHIKTEEARILRNRQSGRMNYNIKQSKNNIHKRIIPSTISKFQRSSNVRLMLNVGKNDNINAGNIVGAIAGEAGISGRVIGSIDIFDNHAFVEVPRNIADTVISTMNRARMKGKRLKLEIVKNK